MHEFDRFKLSLNLVTPWLESRAVEGYQDAAHTMLWQRYT